MGTKKIKLKLDPNLIIAISVMIISLGALFVSYRQAAIMNKQTDLLLDQNRSASWPYLDLNDALSVTDDSNQYRITVGNKGNGPVIIQGVIVTYKGETIKTWRKFLREVDSIGNQGYGFSYSEISSTVISSGENLNIFFVSQLDSINGFAKLVKNLTIEIYYKSIFDEYWVVKNIGFRDSRGTKLVEKIDSIELDENELFLQ